MKRQTHPRARDLWVVLLERSAPWIVGTLMVVSIVLWLLARILGGF